MSLPEGKQTGWDQGKYLLVLGPTLIRLESVQAAGVTIRTKELPPGERSYELPPGTRILTGAS